MRILFYNTNKVPVQEFIQSLDIKDRAKVLACLKSIEDLGWETPRVQFRQIKGKLWEIKIRASTAGYRIFYVTLEKNSLVLLHAYKKQSEKAPAKEVYIAEKRMLEVLKNENDYTH
jgi:phage-related protein